MLQDAGGTQAPRERSAQLRGLLRDELERSEQELDRARSGRERPVVVAFAAAPDALLAIAPLAAAVRVDQAAVSERAWLVAAAAIGAIVQIAELPAPAAPGDLVLEAGSFHSHLALRVPTAQRDDAELAAVAFEEHAAAIARLRSSALALPAHVVAGDARDWRAPLTQAMRSAEAVARLGGRPAEPSSIADYEDAVLALLELGDEVAARPHDDPLPARRVARRILQRLNGMGKWGGYHTDFSHLARGFAGNERALADEVGEALLQAGLLSEKPSVGQRHVFLNPRRVADIRALIERGDVPADLRLPSM